MTGREIRALIFVAALSSAAALLIATGALHRPGADAGGSTASADASSAGSAQDVSGSPAEQKKSRLAMEVGVGAAFFGAFVAIGSGRRRCRFRCAG